MNIEKETILTYENILSGGQKSFSPYFFQPKHRMARVATLIKYLIEEKLQITPEQALETLTLDSMKEWKLDPIIKYVDKPVEFLADDVRHLVYFAYPELPKPTEEELAIMAYKDVLEGRRKTFPKNYFINGHLGERRAITCFRYLCEEILKLDKKDIAKTFSGTKGLQILSKYKLKIIMNVVFFSMVDLLETAYEGELEYK